MGKNNKVLLDNGKEASSSMQLYWNKAKQIQKKKQDQRKLESKEKRHQEMQNTKTGQQQGDDDDNDNKGYISRDTMNNIMKEKERRRQNQYSSSTDNVITETSILNAQKQMTNKAIKIPGYSSEFISSQQLDRNKKEMEKRKSMATAARERKEFREKQEKEGGQAEQPKQPPVPQVQGDQNQQLPPHLANKPPQQAYQNKPPFQPRHPHNRQKDQEMNDPFFKVTEQEDYNPVQEHTKQLQQQHLKAQQQNNSFAPPPPPPNMPPPPLAQGQMPYYPPYYPYPQQQQNYSAPTLPPPPLVPQPIVVEGESTVKRSKIDLTQKKQQFVPRSVLTSSGTSKSSNNTEKKQNQPEALGGNIQNISQAPAPKPFLSGGANPIISNPNNQDLLKQFLSDIESLSKVQNKID